MSAPLAVILTHQPQRFQRWTRDLALDGWEARLEDSASKAAAACRSAELVLALVDIKRPSAAADGAALKSVGPHAAIVVCASSDDPRGVVQALVDWADDHFPEDLQPELLRAKARAHLRRLLPQASLKANAVHSGDGALRLDSDARAVFTNHTAKGWTQLCRLTPAESGILRLLLVSGGRTIARRDLAERMLEEGRRAGNVSTIDKHVESLRRKLARYGARVVTVYGVGYLWQDPA